MKNLSRRSFLKGAAVMAAVGTTGTLLTGAAAAESAAAWDEEFDVIIVGAGLAGLTAAITIAQEGNGTKCLLLEKGATPAGNSPYALGAVLCSKDAEGTKKYLKVLSGDSTPDDVMAAYVDGLVENYDWIKNLGAAEEDMYLITYDETKRPEYPEVDGGESLFIFMFTGAAGGATHVQPFMLEKMKEFSDCIEYRPSTAMESLVQDPADRTITGVVAGGKKLRAKKGVIMCCGGFESDQKMLKDYTGVKAYPLAAPLNTGDGHRACMKVGADMWHMHGGAQFWMSVRNLENTRFLDYVWNFTTKQHGITVGINGRRFYMDADGCMTGTVYDAKDMSRNVGYRHGLTQYGGEWAHLSLPEKAWFIYDADGLAAGAIPESKSTDPVADGWALKADTIEELAALIEVPVEELTETIKTWNGYCEEGMDRAFYRGPDSLCKIANGPFYASLCVPALLNTDGGPRRNAKGEILDPDGNPIPHLYSAGEFGSIWGHCYQGAGNMGECMAFGRIAARTLLNG